MNYRRLGNSGLKVSVLSLGSWLTLGERVTGDAAQSLIDCAVAAGINVFDAADSYGAGHAEKQLGQHLKRHPRSRLVLSSKAYWPMSDDPNDRGLSRKHLFDSVHRSLKNFSTDYLDIFFCHRQDRETPVEETVMAMHDLIVAGKVLYWGTSMWEIAAVERAVRFARKHGFHPPVTEQLPYNLLERWIEKKLPKYKRLGIGVMTWSPLAGGILSGKYSEDTPADSRGSNTTWLEKHLNEQTRQQVRQFSDLAKHMSVTPAQLALAWLMNNPAISSIITGASHTWQLEDNLKALDIGLSRFNQQQLVKLFPR